MNENKSKYIDELYSYIQARYLWQFFPREWDREANINGIISDIINILIDNPINFNDPIEKYFYAEAKVVAEELKEKFKWINELEKQEIIDILNKVKEKLIEVLIEESQNPELKKKSY